MGAQMQRGAYSRVCGASTAFRPVAVGVGGAERGAPMSQSACSRVRGASTAKGAAQRGCSAAGPTPRATGSPAALGYAGAGPAPRQRVPRWCGDRTREPPCVTSTLCDRLVSKGAFTMNKCSVLGLLIMSVFVTGVALAATDATDGRKLEKATFAGGCFWCMEEALDKVDGVVSTTSGYTGGKKMNPTYEDVSAGETGHAESVEVLYDPAKVSYAKLLEVFWHNIDPTTPDRQFCDYGHQYRPAIFYHDETQKRLAEESKKALVKSKPFKGPIVTEIVPASEFYPAEEYHQDFYQKNPIRYRLYKYNCGRAQRLQELWGSTK